MAKLNVVLHGLFSLYETPVGIIAFLPDISGVHVYRAGSWLGETQLRKGAYRLSGTKYDGIQTLSSKTNIDLGSFPLSRDIYELSHAAITLPKPAEIHSLRTVPLAPKTDLEGDIASKIEATALATVQVLVFNADNLRTVRLDGHNWVPPQEDGLDTVNLHIFSEEEMEVEGTDQHAIDSFQKSVEEFAHVSLRFKNANVVPALNPAVDIPPQGVDILELEDLAHRRSRLAAFGDALRSSLPNLRNDPAAVPDDTRAGHLAPLLDPWKDANPHGSDVGACSGTFGGNG